MDKEIENRRRVAIIGSGSYGLACAKSALEEGLTPVVFEKESTFGGVWRAHTGNVWSTLKANTSIYLFGYSDFKWDSSANFYPSPEDTFRYLESYIKAFNLEKYIKYDSLVIKLKQLDDKRWTLKWLNQKTNENLEEIFEYVIVAIGQNTTPFIPMIESQSKFKGMVIHSKDYEKLKTSLNSLKDKKVVVVGLANSGTEISVDLAKNGAAVTNVFRKPYWVMPRFINIDPNNIDKVAPYELLLFKRSSAYQLDKLRTREEFNSFIQRQMSMVLREQNQLPRSKGLYIDPDSKDTPKIGISDDYIKMVKEEKINSKKADIVSFEESKILFDDGSYKNADILIWCTGYLVLLDIFDLSTLQTLEYDPKYPKIPIILYKNTFRAEIENLAFLGILKEAAPVMGELQARWAIRVFSGKTRLPNEKLIKEHYERLRYLCTKDIFVVSENFVKGSDEIAKEINALPNFEEIKQNDEYLYKELMDGVALSAHYRLGDKKDFAINMINEAHNTYTKYLE